MKQKGFYKSMKNKCEVYDLIISLVKGYKNKTNDGRTEHFIESSFGDKKIWLCNIQYLLNQVLRQISIPKDRCLVSQKALEKWNSLVGDEDINNYYYRENVKVKNPGIIEEYKGAKKTPEQPRKVEQGDTFIFRDLFHLEHIVPISVIIEELCKLHDESKLNYENVHKVISTIYVCRMLKEEDRNIVEKHKRPASKGEVIETIYHECGIYLVGETVKSGQ